MVSPYRQIGFHDHHFSNLSDVQPEEYAEDGHILTLLGGKPVWLPPPSGTIPAGGTTGQALAKDSGADGDYDWHDIEFLSTAETDDTLVLKPDGVGGVAFVAEAGSSPAAFTGARVYKAADFTHNSTGNYLPITFDTERYDSSAFHSTGSNTERLVAPSDGYYHVGGCIMWDTNATGNRILGIRWWRADAGDNKFITFEGNVPGASRVQTISADYFMEAGDWIELWAFQSSGGNRTILSIPNASPEFWIHLIGA